ncbi:MAG: metal-dependent transcriptional regulator, partial [Clostridia bacterium]|nr:metal-dependent transcriptional regulator [Clostridia bacterium]
MKLKESGEMYLETIYMLQKELGTVRSIDVCEKMGYSKPSISRAMSLLRQGGYVEMDSQGFLTLTELGMDVAKSMAERHAIISDLLIRFGVSEEVAVMDACKIEHV